MKFSNCLVKKVKRDPKLFQVGSTFLVEKQKQTSNNSTTTTASTTTSTTTTSTTTTSTTTTTTSTPIPTDKQSKFSVPRKLKNKFDLNFHQSSWPILEHRATNVNTHHHIELSCNGLRLKLKGSSNTEFYRLAANKTSTRICSSSNLREDR